jgi:hypothetical protein
VKEMDKNQSDRMEDMLSNLITMVSNINQKMQNVQEEQQLMKQDLSGMKGEMVEIKNILTDMQADQDHIWEKAARNERELAKIKRQLQV